MLHTKIVLSVNAVLIFGGALLFYIFERKNLMQGMGAKETVLTSLFSAVTARTAGFNTIDLNLFSEAGRTIVILLMLTGGGPGSTAGGMKTTTAAVLFAAAIATFSRKEHAHFFGRRIDDSVVKHAATILLMYLVLFFTGGLIISGVENIPTLPCLFETASAVGTVGLTLGITPTLGAVSRCILIILMYVGRVGGLTLIFAAFSRKNYDSYKFPQETITVG